MNITELKELGAIYLENVTDGLRKYPNEIRKLNAEEAYKLLTDKCEEQNWNDVYVDFYYHTFEREVQIKIEESLTEEEIEFVRDLCAEVAKDELIFPLNERLLSVIIKLNAEEVLFSTIYFVNEPRSTWWGNYNQEYVIFTEQ